MRNIVCVNRAKFSCNMYDIELLYKKNLKKYFSDDNRPTSIYPQFCIISEEQLLKMATSTYKTWVKGLKSRTYFSLSGDEFFGIKYRISDKSGKNLLSYLIKNTNGTVGILHTILNESVMTNLKCNSLVGQANAWIDAIEETYGLSKLYIINNTYLSQAESYGNNGISFYLFLKIPMSYEISFLQSPAVQDADEKEVHFVNLEKLNAVTWANSVKNFIKSLDLHIAEEKVIGTGITTEVAYRFASSEDEHVFEQAVSKVYWQEFLFGRNRIRLVENIYEDIL